MIELKIDKLSYHNAGKTKTPKRVIAIAIVILVVIATLRWSLKPGFIIEAGVKDFNMKIESRH